MSYELVIRRGKTERWSFQLGESELQYAVVQAATAAAPCVLTTAAPHGLPEGWPYRITGARGMTALNRPDYLDARVLSATTLEVNDLNTSGSPAYTGGAVLTFNEPMDLTGFSARGHLRASDDGSLLADLSPYLTVDTSLHAVLLELPAVFTAALSLTAKVYDIELYDLAGEVVEVAKGRVRVDTETTQ